MLYCNDYTTELDSTPLFSVQLILRLIELQ